MFLFRVSIVILLFFLLDFYGYRAVKLISKKRIVRWGYIIFNLSLFVSSILTLIYYRNHQKEDLELYSTTFLVIVYVPKLILFVSQIMEGIYIVVVRLIFSRKIHRSKVLNKISLGLYFVCFFYLIYGLFYGRDDFRIERKEIFFENLPREFDETILVQISDLHLGSFGGEKKLEEVIELINKENPDIVVFTGDLVNQTSKELIPYRGTMKNIKSKMGKYSILGNHDYGDYFSWEKEGDKENNLKEIRDFYLDNDFVILEDSNVTLKIDTSSIYILGCNNTSFNNERGDIDKAMTNLSKESFKILLAHDPYHFDNGIKDYPSNIDLTLSGHNHGMQFGLKIGDFKWSLIKYLKKRWTGFYEENNKLLYVNDGVGVSSIFLLRAGITPEITVFTLRVK